MQPVNNHRKVSQSDINRYLNYETVWPNCQEKKFCIFLLNKFEKNSVITEFLREIETNF